MRYKLKDAGLQRTLDQLSGGDFSKALQDFAPNVVNYIGYGERFATDAKGTFSKPTERARFQIRLTDEDVIPIEEYDPKKWNRWPNVTPDTDAWMRIKYREEPEELGPETSYGPFAITCGFFDSGHWYMQVKPEGNIQRYAIYFKPFYD